MKEGYAHGKNEICIQNFSYKTQKEELTRKNEA
jgi:hypothetical protein